MTYFSCRMLSVYDRLFALLREAGRGGRFSPYVMAVEEAQKMRKFALVETLQRLQTESEL